LCAGGRTGGLAAIRFFMTASYGLRSLCPHSTGQPRSGGSSEPLGASPAAYAPATFTASAEHTPITGRGGGLAAAFFQMQQADLSVAWSAISRRPSGSGPCRAFGFFLSKKSGGQRATLGNAESGCGVAARAPWSALGRVNIRTRPWARQRTTTGATVTGPAYYTLQRTIPLLISGRPAKLTAGRGAYDYALLTTAQRLPSGPIRRAHRPLRRKTNR